jgi:MoxR-like ATPase
MSENPPPDELQARLQEFRACFDQLKNEVQKAVIGQEEIIEKTVIAMIAGGHVLLEGVPGLGKTLLVRSLAGALRLTFQRIQFTPDLMPADLIGTKILVDDGHGHSRFEFAPGPVFCNLLLGDEINRATPKTQSALLEAMQEQSVTVGGETRHLKKPFFVLATQNPLEMEGTYPLPEAQLDRFFFKITVNYPDAAAFDRILDLTTARDLPTVEPVFDGSRLVEMGALARDVPVAPTIRQRVVRLIMATHPETEHAIDAVKRYVRYGASPRAGQACLLAAKIRAILQGRFHVAGEDILSVALPVLRHRVMMSFEAQADGVSSDALIEQIFEAEKKTWTA